MTRVWTAVAVALCLVLALALSRGEVRADPPGCPQWETMLAQPGLIMSVQPNELGKPVIEKAPTGWEPFAYTPAGQLVYRRCAR